MDRARLAQPGERFIIFGAHHQSKNGLTGRALHFVAPIVSRLLEGRYHTRGPYMAVEIDDYPAAPDARHWCATQRILWAIDGHDPATDEVPDTREVSA